MHQQNSSIAGPTLVSEQSENEDHGETAFEFCHRPYAFYLKNYNCLKAILHSVTAPEQGSVVLVKYSVPTGLLVQLHC